MIIRYSTTTTIESKVIPGARFTLRVPTLRQRLEYDQRCGPHRQTLRDAVKELAADGTDANRRAELTELISRIEHEQFRLPGLDMFLVEPRTIEVSDGAAVTTMEFPQWFWDGPALFVKEIWDAIHKLLYVSETEAGESPSPIISSAPGDGRETSSSATPAGGSDTIAAAIVSGTSQPLLT